MESNPKENDNVATKVISTENIEKECKRSKKEESNLFLLQVINWGDYLLGKTIRFLKFCSRMYKE